MQCNIDAKGKSVRLIGGMITTAIAVVMFVLAGLDVLTPNWWYFVAGGTLAGGLFQIYEGWSGWCVLRAMGFKTPI